MKDNDLIAFFATKIEEAITKAGWSIPVIQNNQPTQEGIPSGPFVFIEKLMDKQYGWPEASYALNIAPPPGYALPDFLNEEKQWVESTFQVSSIYPQDVTNLTIPTPSDVAHYVKQYLNARRVIAQFVANKTAILRVTDIRNPKFRDDRELFEANPNFDVVIQHRRPIDFSVPGSDTVIGDIISTSDMV